MYQGRIHGPSLLAPLQVSSKPTTHNRNTRTTRRPASGNPLCFTTPRRFLPVLPALPAVPELYPLYLGRRDSLACVYVCLRSEVGWELGLQLILSSHYHHTMPYIVPQQARLFFHRCCGAESLSNRPLLQPINAFIGSSLLCLSLSACLCNRFRPQPPLV